MCMKEDNPGPNLFKGDNLYAGQSYSFVICSFCWVRHSKLDNNKFKIDCTRLLKVINLLKRYWL